VENRIPGPWNEEIYNLQAYSSDEIDIALIDGRQLDSMTAGEVEARWPSLLKSCIAVDPGLAQVLESGRRKH
jgi:hypothetical protein